MTVKQRILTIRLMEKLAQMPDSAETLGIEVTGGIQKKPDQQGLTNK